jgi:hypothetical protein
MVGQPSGRKQSFDNKRDTEANCKRLSNKEAYLWVSHGEIFYLCKIVKQIVILS